MKRVLIMFEDLCQDKQEEIVEAIEELGLNVNDVLNSSHEIYIQCDLTEEGVDFE